MSRSALLPRGDAAIRRLRAALETRPLARLPRTLPNRRIDPHPEARLFWSERAWSELAAIPAMAQTTLALVRASESTDVLDAIARIQSDEVRHTELSRDLADAFGGYLAEIPRGSAYDPLALAAPHGDALPFWIVGNGCLSETLSLELMRVRLAHTTHPAVRPILRHIMKDEAMHARVSWTLAEEVLPYLAPIDREELGELASDMLQLLEKSFSSARLAPAERRAARNVRTKVAEAGLGAAPWREEEAAFRACVKSVIRPRLERLGVRVD